MEAPLFPVPQACLLVLLFCCFREGKLLKTDTGGRAEGATETKNELKSILLLLRSLLSYKIRSGV